MRVRTGTGTGEGGVVGDKVERGVGEEEGRKLVEEGSGGSCRVGSAFCSCWAGSRPPYQLRWPAGRRVGGARAQPQCAVDCAIGGGVRHVLLLSLLASSRRMEMDMEIEDGGVG